MPKKKTDAPVIVTARFYGGGDQRWLFAAYARACLVAGKKLTYSLFLLVLIRTYLEVEDPKERSECATLRAAEPKP